MALPHISPRSYEHDRLSWAASSLFVIGYSYVISMTVPYFSSLVGIVAGEHVGAAGQRGGDGGEAARAQAVAVVAGDGTGGGQAAHPP